MSRLRKIGQSYIFGPKCLKEGKKDKNIFSQTNSGNYSKIPQVYFLYNKLAKSYEIRSNWPNGQFSGRNGKISANFFSPPIFPKNYECHHISEILWEKIVISPTPPKSSWFGGVQSSVRVNLRLFSGKFIQFSHIKYIRNVRFPSYVAPRKRKYLELGSIIFGTVKSVELTKSKAI